MLFRLRVHLFMCYKTAVRVQIRMENGKVAKKRSITGVGVFRGGVTLLLLLLSSWFCSGFFFGSFWGPFWNAFWSVSGPRRGPFGESFWGPFGVPDGSRKTHHSPLFVQTLPPPSRPPPPKKTLCLSLKLLGQRPGGLL